ncbi:MAG: iron-sulfur cluster carrier protein ApbC [Nevskia sp.]|nr:iron-sulfur cluster carrier protein ApbC [Nevskia sp.]
MSDPQALLAAASQYHDPLIGKTLGEARVGLSVSGSRLRVTLGFPAAGYRAALAAALRAHLAPVAGEVTVDVDWSIGAGAVQKDLQSLPGVKNILAVASGKGGVGKSTVAVNLALALQVEGARVGILDADLYGPSQPLMLGSHDKPTSPDGRRMNPIRAHGLQAMSIGFLMSSDSQPTIWRGPMATQALWQLLTETVWDQLDYLVVDMPPGTGDIQLSLSQKVPVAGSVIVTTPQDIALLDARKGLEMFRKVGIPVLGVVENMSTHICSSCGHEEPIFGTGGGQRLAQDAGTELLGSLPLDIRIRQQADGGNPTVAADPESPLAQRYRDIARLAAARLAYGPAADAAFPSIDIAND